MNRPGFRVLACVLLGFFVCTPLVASAAEPADPPIYVFLWFDTEDYLLPADDDATLHLCQFLTDEGLRATFKLVGEKARVLETRGRRDVLEALAKHEIGYHSNFHSVQPTPALFLSRQGWDDGVAEFDRREHQGLLDVARITGQKPSCYGQPGSSWGPQQFGAMDRWGVHVYLDAGSHVSLGGDPFWYCRVLNLYALRWTLRTKLGGPDDLKEAKEQFDKAHRALREAGGGPVSIYYHPCEFVHKQFWDGVNFARGANPPRSEWKLPPEKSPEESRIAYETFEGYIRFIKAYPGVRFITAKEGLELYRDTARGRRYTRDQIHDIAGAVRGGTIDFQKHDGYALAPSEVFGLLNEFVARETAADPVKSLTLEQTPFGPTAGGPPAAEVTTNLSQLERTAQDVSGYMARHGRVPNAVWLGSAAVAPESYLALLGDYITASQSGDPPATLTARPASLAAADRVSADAAKLWGWVIFPPNFRAPEMMELAKQQAWTIKPAMLADDR